MRDIRPGFVVGFGMLVLAGIITMTQPARADILNKLKRVESIYVPAFNTETERWELCWADNVGRGNCMDVGVVFELIREAQNKAAAEDLENAI